MVLQVQDYVSDPLNFVGKIRSRTGNELLKVIVARVPDPGFAAEPVIRFLHSCLHRMLNPEIPPGTLSHCSIDCRERCRASKSWRRGRVSWRCLCSRFTVLLITPPASALSSACSRTAAAQTPPSMKLQVLPVQFSCFDGPSMISTLL